MVTMESEIVDILERVLKLDREVLQSLGQDVDLLEYNLNSIIVVELVVELEAHFEIAIDDDDLLTENVATIGRIMQLVGKYQTVEHNGG
jgi:acyl carrier protein